MSADRFSRHDRCTTLTLAALVPLVGLAAAIVSAGTLRAEIKNVKVLVSERCSNETRLMARPMSGVDVSFIPSTSSSGTLIRTSDARGHALFQLPGLYYDIRIKAPTGSGARLELIGHGGERYEPNPDTQQVEKFLVRGDMDLDLYVVRNECVRSPPPPPALEPPPPAPTSTTPQKKPCPAALSEEYAQLRRLEASLNMGLYSIWVDEQAGLNQRWAGDVLRAGIDVLGHAAGAAADFVSRAAEKTVEGRAKYKLAQGDFAGVSADADFGLTMKALADAWAPQFSIKASAARAIGRWVPETTEELKARYRRLLDEIEKRRLSHENLASELDCKLQAAPAPKAATFDGLLLGLHPPIDPRAPVADAIVTERDTVVLVSQSLLLTNERFAQQLATMSGQPLSLNGGTVVVATLPDGRSGPRIKTPEAAITPEGTAYLVHRGAARRLTFVYVSAGEVEVTPTAGSAVRLGPGEAALADDRGVRKLVPTSSAATHPRFENDTNRHGSDYADFVLPAADPGLCAERCRNDNSCRAWTYVKPGQRGPNAHCYLKNPAPRPTADPCCVSGTVPRIIDQQVHFENHTNRYGSDYADFDLPAGNPDLCYERCKADDRCAAWTFVRPGVQGPGARCYLKDPAPPASQNDCCVSGVMPRGSQPPAPRPPAPQPPPPPPPTAPPPAAPPPAGATSVDWNTTAKDHEKSPDGSRFRYDCPPYSGQGFVSMWGTDVYTFDSGICMAAVHAGVITREGGGVVTIEMRPGLSGYPATVRYGVSSQGYGAYHKSFTFVSGAASAVAAQGATRSAPSQPVAAAPPATGAMTATWYTSGKDHISDRAGSRFSYQCPPFSGEFLSMWGTDVYTYDSGVCMAGVHAGVITKERGGVVIIEMRPGQDAYAATLRHGVWSQSFGMFHWSFAVVAGAPAAAAPPG